MKVLVTGARGLLGRAVVEEGQRRGYHTVALGRDQLDVTDEAAVRARLQRERPGVVIQCAGYTGVDGAETEPELAMRVNATAACFVAEACNSVGALCVYPSSDYVFDGAGSRPYRPKDAVCPLNRYGESKAAGEEAVRSTGRSLVVRTSWLYGRGGRHFVGTILRAAQDGSGPLRVVDDQIGRPTWTTSLASVIYDLGERGAQGMFHATGGGEPVSWYRFARAVLAGKGLRLALLPVPSSARPRPAPRPAYSVLDCTGTERVTGRPMPSWRESLTRYLDETRYEREPA
ncbi:MAG: dTDP-4-dehydrorhamnose reductase [Longimicrobiaceae bacterium]